jgi:hypothetical protein
VRTISAHALRHFQALHHALEALAVCDGGDLAAEMPPPRAVLGIRTPIAAGQRQVGGQRRALVAALFLDDLDQHDLPAADHFLNLVLAHQPAATARQLFFHRIVFVVFADGDAGVFLLVLVVVLGLGGAATGLVVMIVLVVVLVAHQRFAVGEGDLIVVGVDFVEGEEAVTIAAVLDEGRLQRRLNARHLGEIDIPSELLAVLALEIEFFNAVSVDHHHTRLFGVRGIDQHILGHQT